MPPRNRKPGGWVLPGYKYLGPFNPLDNGEPINAADAAARKHDFAYDKYLKQGVNPYLYFNKADQDLIDDLRDDWSIGGLIASGVFKAKKLVAPAHKETPSNIESKAQKRKWYFANSNKRKNPKKPEGPPNKQQKKMDTSDTQENNPGNEPAVASISAGNGGGGTTGSKGAGVGISTGGWVGGSSFGSNTVITRNTRQFMVKIQNGHQYKNEKIANSTNEHTQRCVSTPWSYFNFNEYSCHFSPQDWQRLINEYKKWRPKAMRVQIYNLQIKQIVTPTGGGDNTYNNDLTAGVHIFCDGSHQYPYAIHPWDADVMPEIPTDVWNLSQYGWICGIAEMLDMDGTPTDIDRIYTVDQPMYMLENSDHKVLRTGEQTEFSFEFDTEWVTNERAYINPGRMFNPLTKTKRCYYLRNRNADGSLPNLQTGSYVKYQPFQKPTSWFPGPGLQEGSRVGPQRSCPTAYANGTKITGITNNASVGNMSSPLDPTSGPQPPNGLEYNFCFTNTPNFGNSPNGTAVMIQRPSQTLLRDQILYRGNGVTLNNEVKETWMFPNQVWDRMPITRYSPIWCKKPRADRTTIIDPFDGSLATDHPPGTIFMKMAKIPVPGSGDSYLNVYCTGQVSVEIAWEVERYATKNWRPERRFTTGQITIGEGEIPTYMVSETGSFRLPASMEECMMTKCGINKIL